jgi:outer membrane lipoprotein-sorting protein
VKLWLATAAVLFLSGSAHAQAAKPCEDLKSEIAQKLDAKGVKSYTLEIVAKDKDAEGKVVGTCEGGTKKILYRREAASTETTPPAEPKKP